MAKAKPARDPETGKRSLGRRDWATWPRYEAAVLGFRDYWYPVTWSRKVTATPLAVVLGGERIMLIREAGVVRAHRAWSMDDAYPVAERLGLVFVYLGEGEPAPLEMDLPSELVAPDAVVLGRITTRPGNWRFGAENGFDEGHAKYLHRRSLWTLRRQMPTWVRHHIEPTGEGWITRFADEIHYDTEFPGLGTWPPHRAWRSQGRGKAIVSIRLPCLLRVAYAHWQHYEWWVPSDEGHHTYVQLVSKRAAAPERLRFSLYYWLWVRWVFHGLFNDEDRLMVDVMDAPPERLYRPDVAITEWRKLCEQQQRGVPQAATGERVGRTGNGAGGEPDATHRYGLPITHRLRELLGR